AAEALPEFLPHLRALVCLRPRGRSRARFRPWRGRDGGAATAGGAGTRRRLARHPHGAARGHLGGSAQRPQVQRPRRPRETAEYPAGGRPATDLTLTPTE